MSAKHDEPSESFRSARAVGSVRGDGPPPSSGTASARHGAAVAPDRRALLVGQFRPKIIAEINETARAAGFSTERCADAPAALAHLGEDPAHCLLVEHEQAEALCLSLRSHTRHANVPVVSIVPEPSELAFAEIFSWGGEDVVAQQELPRLRSRLRRLPSAPAPSPEGQTKRRALVVASDRVRRTVLGRVLLGAGYAIQFAGNREETEASLRELAPRLVVVDSDDLAFFERLRQLAREAQETLFIFSTPPRRVRQCRHGLAETPNLALTDSFAPPENVVFLANELGRSRGVDNRASRRLLYGTLVAFRCAGRERDDSGLTYNVSHAGLYVRSLLSPVEDTLWLELTPPRSDRRVRLEGEVCWRRPFGPSTLATVPPGFGVRISDGARAELRAWERGYAALACAFGGVDE